MRFKMKPARTGAALLAITAIANSLALAPNQFTSAASASVVDCSSSGTTFDPSDFRTIGDASVAGSVVTLTPASQSKSGGVWNRGRFDLRQDFCVSADLRFTAAGDSDGADGIAFVIQPLSTSALTPGGGIGYGGLDPSFAVEFDTYFLNSGDPGFNHIALMRDGNATVHNAFADPVRNDVLETDNRAFPMLFQWDASAETVTVTFDGVIIFQNVAADLRSIIGSDFAYWGFTAATGGQVNEHSVRSILYGMTERTNAAPSFATQPSSRNITAGVSAAVAFTLADDLTSQAQWSFAVSVTDASSIISGSPQVTMSDATNGVIAITTTGTLGSAVLTLTATDADGASATSSQFTVTTVAPPDPPTGLESDVWNGQIRLRWTPPASASDVTGYRIEHRAVGAPTWIPTDPVGLGTSSVVKNLDNGTSYEFRVASRNGAAAGAFTQSVTATPLAFYPASGGAFNVPAGLVLLNHTSSNNAWNGTYTLNAADRRLATRTLRNPLTRSGASAPYTMSRIDNGTTVYSYLTDVGYLMSGGQANEGDERAMTSAGNFTRTDGTVFNAVPAIRLQSSMQCLTANLSNPTTFCSVFGPELWSPPFEAASTDGLAFNIAAAAGSDDYEFYGYLVKVTADPNQPGGYDFGDGLAANYTIAAYGRGKDLDWQTVTGGVPSAGVYRFRFVNGSFDRTGGFALGSSFYVDPASVRVGKIQSISNFGALDAFGGAADTVIGVYSGATVDALRNASATSGLPVQFESLNSAVCTVASDGSSLEVHRRGTCTIQANQSGGPDANSEWWAPAASQSRSFIVTGLPQTTTFLAPPNADRFTSDTISASATSSADLAIAFTTSTPGVCSVGSAATSGGETTANVTFASVGTCTVAATQSGSSIYDPASTVTRSFMVNDTRLDQVSSGLPGLDSAFDARNTTYSTDVATSVAEITLDATAVRNDATLQVQGAAFTSGTPVTLPLAVGSNTVTISVTRAGETRTYSFTIRRAAPPSQEIVAPPLPPGPVLTAGAPPRPSPTPVARVGDVEIPVASTPAGTTRQVGTTTVSTATILEVGTVALALDVTGAGEVRTNAGAAPEVTVVRDRVARTSGGGLLPGTQVQAWLPLGGGNARPVVNLPVAEDGTFTGELPFDGRTDRQTDGRPLPIGTHVLQLVGVDATGQITVIEQTVRIEQPAPSPEPDRRAGAPPTLSPGASIATNAGVPEAVTIVPVPEVRQARVEGTGWTMAVDIPSADGRVAPAEGGGALIELVEEDFAEVSGDGFLPGTRADVWLFSTPTLLGTVTIGPDGSFTGLVPVTGIATGEHTLQLQGVGRDGYVRAANLGVAVVPRASEEPAPQPEPEPELEATPEPAPERPADSVEVVTATGPEPSGGSPLVWIALLAAVLGSSGWWFLIGRRRRDDEDEAHQG